MPLKRVPAEELTPGMQFMLFAKLCTVVDAESNDYGMTVVHFVMDDDNSPEVNVLIVPPSTPFSIST